MKLIIKTQKFNKNLFIKNFLIFLIKKFLLIKYFYIKNKKF